MKFFLRAILIALPWNLAIIAALTSLQYLDVSPLPAVTLIIFGYLIHALITWVFAEWVFARQAPRLKEFLIVFFVFCFSQIAIQILVQLWANQGRWQDVALGFGWPSFSLIVLYFLMIGVASFHARRRYVKQTLPEGLEG